MPISDKGVVWQGLFATTVAKELSAIPEAKPGELEAAVVAGEKAVLDQLEYSLDDEQLKGFDFGLLRDQKVRQAYVETLKQAFAAQRPGVTLAQAIANAGAAMLAVAAADDAHGSPLSAEVNKLVAAGASAPLPQGVDPKVLDTLAERDDAGKLALIAELADKGWSPAHVALINLAVPGALARASDRLVALLKDANSTFEVKKQWGDALVPVLEAHGKEPEAISALKQVCATTYFYSAVTSALIALEHLDFPGKTQFFSARADEGWSEAWASLVRLAVPGATTRAGDKLLALLHDQKIDEAAKTVWSKTLLSALGARGTDPEAVAVLQNLALGGCQEAWALLVSSGVPGAAARAGDKFVERFKDPTFPEDARRAACCQILNGLQPHIAEPEALGVLKKLCVATSGTGYGVWNVLEPIDFPDKLQFFTEGANQGSWEALAWLITQNAAPAVGRAAEQLVARFNDPNANVVQNDRLFEVLQTLLEAHAGEPEVLAALRTVATSSSTSHAASGALGLLAKLDFADKVQFFTDRAHQGSCDAWVTLIGLGVPGAIQGAQEAVETRLNQPNPESADLATSAMAAHATSDWIQTVTQAIAACRSKPEAVAAIEHLCTSTSASNSQFLSTFLSGLDPLNSPDQRRFVTELAEHGSCEAWLALIEMSVPGAVTRAGQQLLARLNDATVADTEKTKWGDTLSAYWFKGSEGIAVLQRLCTTTFGKYGALALGVLARSDFPGKVEFFKAQAEAGSVVAWRTLISLGAPGAITRAADKLLAIVNDPNVKDEVKANWVSTLVPVLGGVAPEGIEALKRACTETSYYSCLYSALSALAELTFPASAEFLAERVAALAPSIGTLALGADRLDETQRTVLAHARAYAAQLSAAARDQLLAAVKTLGYTEADLERCLAFVRDQAPATVNFSPDKALQKCTPDGVPGLSKCAVKVDRTQTVIDAFLADSAYRNQFETGVTSGSPGAFPGGSRDTWEKTIFRGDYHTHPLIADERPKYGALNPTLTSDGGALSYGSCYFVLEPDVRRRITITPTNSSGCTAEQVGTLDDCMHVLAQMHPTKLKATMEAALHGTHEAGTSWVYVEMQVHGPIELDKDVAELVADPGYRGTPYEDKLRLLCLRHGIKLSWKSGAENVPDAGPVPR